MQTRDIKGRYIAGMEYNLMGKMEGMVDGGRIKQGMEGGNGVNEQGEEEGCNKEDWDGM